MRYLDYLIEIRRRLLSVVAVFFSFFVCLFFLSDKLFLFLVHPLMSYLPSGNQLIATNITSPVIVPLKLAANAAMLLSAPIFLIQLWAFTAPALFPHEKNIVTYLIAGSVCLFVAGILFCFFGVLPFMFQFFIQSVPTGVKMMPDINQTLDFITHMLMVFGLCFQIPLICAAMVKFGWVSIELLKEIRPYAIVGAFILGMLLTPPDVLSQCILAFPLCALYELGIIFSKYVKRYTV